MSARARGVPTGNVYDKYSATNPVERRLVDGFLRAFDDALPGRAVTTVVEVGAGEGVIAERVARRYPEAGVCPLDLPDPRLGSSWRRKGLNGAYADAVRLPARDGAADLVVCIEVLEHLPDPAAALAEIARVASADVVLSVPLEPLWRVGNVLRGRYLADWGNTPGHLNHWSRRGFVRFVSRHLDVLEVRSPLPWTLVRAASR